MLVQFEDKEDSHQKLLVVDKFHNGIYELNTEEYH